MLGVQNAVRQAALAELLLNYTVLDSWGSYCEAEGIVETATLAQLLQYLRATYDTISSSYEAFAELVSLKFSADANLPQFNQQFDHLVSKAELSANQPHQALNHYRHTMPTNIKKELFAADIVNVLDTRGEPMDIDRVAVKLNTRRGSNNHSGLNTRQGLQFNAEQFPCMETEFHQRLEAG
ncbi:hypothetical protein GGH17_002537, partial [Coemansia sp. RSA 788]